MRFAQREVMSKKYSFSSLIIQKLLSPYSFLLANLLKFSYEI